MCPLGAWASKDFLYFLFCVSASGTKRTFLGYSIGSKRRMSNTGDRGESPALLQPGQPRSESRGQLSQMGRWGCVATGNGVTNLFTPGKVWWRKIGQKNPATLSEELHSNWCLAGESPPLFPVSLLKMSAEKCTHVSEGDRQSGIVLVQETFWHSCLPRGLWTTGQNSSADSSGLWPLYNVRAQQISWMVSRRLICSSLNNKHVSQGKYWISLFYCKLWLIAERNKEKFKVNFYLHLVCLGSSKARCSVSQIIHFHCPHYPFVFFKQHFTQNGNNSDDRKRVNQTSQLLSSGQICLHRRKSLQTTAFLPDPLSTAFCYFNCWQQVIHTLLKSIHTLLKCLQTTSDGFLLQLNIKAGRKTDSREKSFCWKPKWRQRKMPQWGFDTHCAFKYPSNPGLWHRVPSS